MKWYLQVPFCQSLCFLSEVGSKQQGVRWKGDLRKDSTPKGSNKLALALRNAANTIDRTKDGVLTRFFKRKAYQKGRGAAITATARKLAVIIWNMVVKKEPYQPIDTEFYKELIKQKTIATMKKQMLKMGIQPHDLGPAFQGS